MELEEFLKNIILVDDDPSFHLIAKKNLSKIEVRIPFISLYDGNQLMDAISKKDHLALSDYSNLVLLDLNMPEMDGWQFLEEFSQLDQSLQKRFFIVILTSSISLSERNRGLSYPMVKGYYHKPMNKNGIQGILDDYLAKVTPQED
ncbi:MAG: response regulator [Bacteroidota bacterium]